MCLLGENSLQSSKDSGKDFSKGKKSCLERNSLLLPTVTWSELFSCFRGSGRGFLISF